MIKTINCMVTMETRLKHDGYFFVDVWHDFINLMLPVGEEFPVYDRSVYMAQMTPQRRNIQQGIYLDIYIEDPQIFLIFFYADKSFKVIHVYLKVKKKLLTNLSK